MRRTVADVPCEVRFLIAAEPLTAVSPGLQLTTMASPSGTEPFSPIFAAPLNGPAVRVTV